MIKNFILLILMTAGLYSCGTKGEPIPEKEAIDPTKSLEQRSLTYDLDRFVDTEFRYPNAIGKTVVIQNGLPKGGGDIEGIRGYFDATGKHYGYGIFWTRVINETDASLDVSIKFPAESFEICPSPDAHYKLFLPTDTMSFDKLTLYNYGITGLKTFLDTNFNKPNTFQKSIKPNQELVFYVALLLHVPNNGRVRTGFVLKGKDLFYKVDIAPYDFEIIPCGKIEF